MKKKIIAAVMAITLLLAVFAMTVSAAYVKVFTVDDPNASIYYSIDLWENTTTHKYTMVGSADNISGQVTVRLQCTVCYTDGTYDQGYANPGSSTVNVDVYYDTSKTIWYVDMEMHIFDGSSYIDTVSYVYP